MQWVANALVPANIVHTFSRDSGLAQLGHLHCTASVCPGSNARALETVLQPEGDRMFHFYDGHHFLGMHLLWWIFWIGFIVLAFGVFQPVRRTRG